MVKILHFGNIEKVIKKLTVKIRLLELKNILFKEQNKKVKTITLTLQNELKVKNLILSKKLYTLSYIFSFTIDRQLLIKNFQLSKFLVCLAYS